MEEDREEIPQEVKAAEVDRLPPDQAVTASARAAGTSSPIRSVSRATALRARSAGQE